MGDEIPVFSFDIFPDGFGGARELVKRGGEVPRPFIPPSEGVWNITFA